MSEVKVNKVSPRTGTDIELGDSGDTVSVTGNIVKTNAVQGSDGGNIISQSGTTNTIGATGDVIKTAAGTTKLEVQGDGSSVEGKIQLNCHANSHGVILQSPPHSSGQSWTIKLPDNQIAADKFIKIKSITGSGATAVGQAEFADAGGGAMTFLSATSVANASSVTVGTFSSTYSAYKIIIAGMTPETTNQDLYFRFIKSDGSEETATSYRYTVGGFRESTTSLEGYGSSSAQSSCKWARNVHNNTGTLSADILITNPQQSIRTSIIGVSNKRFTNDAYAYAETIGCFIDATTSYTQIKFYPASGNWNAVGKIMVYGLKES